MNKEYSNLTANDMVGMQFGKITVIKRLQNDKKRNAILLCKCGCGKEFSARASQIKSGKTKSCGCRAGTRFDIAGKKFGKLTAIKKQEGQKREMRYGSACVIVVQQYMLLHRS